MKTGPFVAALAAALLLFAAHAHAARLLYIEGGYNVFYHHADDTTWCNKLDSLFTADSVTDVWTQTDDFSHILEYDRVMLTVGGFNGDYHANRPDHLTATQIENLQAFVATGRRVVILGEWCAPNWTDWRNWDLSVLGALGTGPDDGPDFTPYGFSAFPSSRMPTSPSGNAGTEELVAGVSAVVPALAGGVLGGNQVFQVHFLSLFGPQDNVLYSGDSDFFLDNYMSLTADGSNRNFIRNVASWLHGPAVVGVGPGSPAAAAAGPAWRAFPNPARAGVGGLTLRAGAGHGSRVRILDTRGRLVREVEGRAGASGSEARWDGRDVAGRLVDAGVYFLADPAGGGRPGRVVVLR